MGGSEQRECLSKEWVLEVCMSLCESSTLDVHAYAREFRRKSMSLYERTPCGGGGTHFALRRGRKREKSKFKEKQFADDGGNNRKQAAAPTRNSPRILIHMSRRMNGSTLFPKERNIRFRTVCIKTHTNTTEAAPNSVLCHCCLAGCLPLGPRKETCDVSM